MPTIGLTRRSFLGGVTLAAAAAPVWAQPSAPRILVHKDPNCGCCAGWVDHIRAAGFVAEVQEQSDLTPLKARLGIPSSLASCHTAQAGGYVIEGHVPASAIKRLLAERPAARGLAVAGMPVGSPGMEVPGAEEQAYDVVLFGPSGQRVYARFKGLKELAGRG